jgi:opacity protein-like surface antigen
MIMIKKMFLLVAFMFATSILVAQDLSYPRLGVGFQANFPAGGLSVKADLTEQHSAQAVIGLFGPFSSYYGRYIYNFSESGENFLLKPYVYAQAGIWKYDIESYGLDLTGTGLEDSESSFGYGIGAGLEFTYPQLSDKLKYSVEIGYSNVDLLNYDFNSIAFGVGLHYYFNL